MLDTHPMQCPAQDCLEHVQNYHLSSSVVTTYHRYGLAYHQEYDLIHPLHVVQQTANANLCYLLMPAHCT
jgi:hypothetical protein